MRIPRFYTQQPLAENQSCLLEEPASRHLLRVLRLRPGDKVELFNGNGKEYQATLDQAENKQARLTVHSSRTPERESPLQLELGQGISRGERMDFVLQKSVELGVASITPLWTGRSQVRLDGTRLEKRIRHWKGVVHSACEQSGRVTIPDLNPASSLEDWCKGNPDPCLRLVLDPTASKHLKQLTPASRIQVLIGPEGGLTDEEIMTAEKNGFERVRLGPRIMRTETASLATLTALQVLWGDLTD